MAACAGEGRGPFAPMTITQEAPNMSSTTRRTGPAETHSVHSFGGEFVDQTS